MVSLMVCCPDRFETPSFNTIMHNLRYVYSTHWWSSGNMLIVNLRNIGIVPYV